MMDIHAEAHPEENLWAAVIRQAIHDALSKPTIHLKAHAIRESREWLTKPNIQFDYVCELAGKCPVRTRKAVVKMLAEREQQPPKPRRDRSTKRQRKTLTLNGRTQTIGQWAKECGLSYGMVAARIRHGWTVEAALTTPFVEQADRFKLYGKRDARRGAGSDSEKSAGTGGGSTAHDLLQTEFSQQKVET